MFWERFLLVDARGPRICGCRGTGRVDDRVGSGHQGIQAGLLFLLGVHSRTRESHPRGWNTRVVYLVLDRRRWQVALGRSLPNQRQLLFLFVAFLAFIRWVPLVLGSPPTQSLSRTRAGEARIGQWSAEIVIPLKKLVLSTESKSLDSIRDLASGSL
ncbi:hypothetical protein B296_00015605 [Ensete ventricosum]|uniref:Uncharacterized protein n=1 Tax=Ensete ventricosum TaxID=4639 RepID=A0A427A6Y7_ENSVE|nr:hypothetical protein B296_00015605 [Ensete ventricosum]